MRRCCAHRARSPWPVSSERRSSGCELFIFGTAAALVFNQVFFPSFDPVTGTLAAFASFSVGFIARPFGGAVFAHYGDKIGRKPMLVYSLLLMGAATVLMGLLPGYEIDRHLGADPARPTAFRPGLRCRRRVGWRSADGRRARSPSIGAASTVLGLKLACRPASSSERAPMPCCRPRCPTGGFPRVGVAGPVPDQHAAHRSRHVDPAHRGRSPIFQEALDAKSAAKMPGASMPSRPIRKRLHLLLDRSSPPTPRSTSDRSG